MPGGAKTSMSQRGTPSLCVVQHSRTRVSFTPPRLHGAVSGEMLTAPHAEFFDSRFAAILAVEPIAPESGKCTSYPPTETARLHDDLLTLPVADLADRRSTVSKRR
jgi:hypothetical protein